ncbi:MAG: Poly-beta-1,6-N-acetyl-D-glucosamine synthase [bacterium ADurb.Bin400]|nr:MAG: Poly-beta-1,6-N-acetyl-D-glucosamine synthase [bacterium ADurb.Bin400]
MGDLLDCITVVPGVVGAFRVSAINKVGGFSTNTLAEDTDLTFAIKKAGYKIVYDQAAIAYTEAPQNYRDWLKQRYRWTFGTMQAVWKHRTSFLNPAHNNFGMIGLPYLVVYQIIFPLLNPVFDLVLVIGLITGRINLMVIALAAYTVLDFIYAGIALKLDREKLFNLWLIIPQRIIYRPFQYYIIVKSFLNVLKGQWVGWNKLKREGKLLAKMQKSGFSKT